MGTLTFDKPGVFHLVMKPADLAAWKAVNLWRVQMALNR